MTINSPDAMPDDDPQLPAEKDARGGQGDIPQGQEGVGLGAAGEPNTFEPEEGPEATDPEAADSE